MVRLSYIHRHDVYCTRTSTTLDRYHCGLEPIFPTTCVFRYARGMPTLVFSRIFFRRCCLSALLHDVVTMQNQIVRECCASRCVVQLPIGQDMRPDINFIVTC